MSTAAEPCFEFGDEPVDFGLTEPPYDVSEAGTDLSGVDDGHTDLWTRILEGQFDEDEGESMLETPALI